MRLENPQEYLALTFIFGKPTRKQQTMVKLQLAANTIAKSRSQIKPKPAKGSPINTILIFPMAVH